MIISNAYLAFIQSLPCLALFASALSDATLLASPQELSKVLQARCSYVVRAEKKDEGKVIMITVAFAYMYARSYT